MSLEKIIELIELASGSVAKLMASVRYLYLDSDLHILTASRTLCQSSYATPNIYPSYESIKSI